MICIYILFWMEETCEHASMHCQQKYIPIISDDWAGNGWLIFCPGKLHDHVIKWKHFPRYPVNSPHKGQWRGALMFSLICAWINYWVNNGDAGDLRRHRAHYDVTVMFSKHIVLSAGTMTSSRVCVFRLGECCHAILHIYWELDYYLAANGKHINHTIFLIKKGMPYLIRKIFKNIIATMNVFGFPSRQYFQKYMIWAKWGEWKGKIKLYIHTESVYHTYIFANAFENHCWIHVAAGNISDILTQGYTELLQWCHMSVMATWRFAQELVEADNIETINAQHTGPYSFPSPKASNVKGAAMS